mgnify:FL=1|tara:strand:+ start:646 stop:1440 length:795 start_codon:yes stop_codon:yes gene_type:complete
MANRAFCIGNGKSRRGFDLRTLKPRGVILGCNNLYKDFAPDVLVAIDHPIMHNIYQSGYCYNAKCYFRSWSPIPGENYEQMILGMFPDFRHLRGIRQSGKLIENGRAGCKEFVLHGYNDKQTGENLVSVSWVTNDRVMNVTDIIKDAEQEYWAAGPVSGYVACKTIDEIKEVYLIGHDLFSMDNKFNNIYAGQPFYKSDTHPSGYYVQQWIYQWKKLFKWYHWIKFYKVNRRSFLNINIPEWEDCKNLEYISYERMESQTRNLP